MPGCTSRRITGDSGGRSSLMRCSSADGGLLPPTAAVPRRISVPSSRSMRIAVCVASPCGFATIARTFSPSKQALR
jgi:hypothetical protein